MGLRLTGFLLILGILGLSGYAALGQARKGTLNPIEHVSQAEMRGELASAQYVLGIVSSQLEQVKQLDGSYAGTLDLDNFPLVRLVRADKSSYCLEFTKTNTFVLAGPGGTTALGHC